MAISLVISDFYKHSPQFPHYGVNRDGHNLGLIQFGLEVIYGFDSSYSLPYQILSSILSKLPSQASHIDIFWCFLIINFRRV